MMTDNNNREVVQYDKNAVRALFQRAGLSWQLFWDGRVNIFSKLIPLASIAYVLSPVDFAPALAMGPLAPLGTLDDIGILALGLGIFIQLAPKDIVQEYLSGMSGRRGTGPDADYGDDDVIEGEYEYTDE
jgi:uncharacterized membrane protein YkvA (DUF1232 family)